MFSFLVRILGQYRAEVLRYYVREYAVLSIAGILGIAGMTALVLWFDPEKHVHDGYIIAEVQGIVPTGSTYKNSFVVDVSLADGTPLRLLTSKGAVVGSITEKACLERRRTPTGRIHRYILSPAWKCKGW